MQILFTEPWIIISRKLRNVLTDERFEMRGWPIGYSLLCQLVGKKLFRNDLLFTDNMLLRNAVAATVKMSLLLHCCVFDSCLLKTL